jgi:hypothetical protein
LFEDKETLITELEKLFKKYNLSGFDSDAAHNEIYQNNLKQNNIKVMHIRLEHKKQKVQISFYTTTKFKERKEITKELKDICKANDYALKDMSLNDYVSDITNVLLQLRSVLDDDNLDDEDLDTIGKIISDNDKLKDVLAFLRNA